jgi:hypothetical protein
MMRSHSSYICLVYLLGVTVVRLIGSGFWVWGGGEDSDGVTRIILFGVFCVFGSVPSVGVALLIMLHSCVSAMGLVCG